MKLKRDAQKRLKPRRLSLIEIGEVFLMNETLKDAKF